MRFQDLPLCPELLHACSDLGFRYCTPIQKISLPAALQGKDVAGQAQTGTGKTAAFLLSIYQRFVNHPREIRPGHPRALIVAPTRELALQIGRDAEKLGAHLPFRALAVFGGEEMDKQHRILIREPVHLLAATPGRLLDFQRRRDIHLSEVEILVLDEADRMLDMGFIPDVRRIIHSTPPRERRQTMLFSATLSPDILRLASQWTRNPIRLEVEADAIAAQTVDQRVYVVTTHDKTALLVNLLRQSDVQRTLLFVNRRDTGEHAFNLLKACGFQVGLISGALPQDRRSKTLQAFREGRIAILVATDVAGRGIHIDGVSHVINYNLPQDPEDYVHRIGRTGRAGALGTSISFASEDESFYLPDIEKFMGRELPCTRPDDAWLVMPSDLKELRVLTTAPRRSRPPGGFSNSRRSGSRGPRRR